MQHRLTEPAILPTSEIYLSTQYRSLRSPPPAILHLILRPHQYIEVSVEIEIQRDHAGYWLRC